MSLNLFFLGHLDGIAMGLHHEQSLNTALYDHGSTHTRAIDNIKIGQEEGMIRAVLKGDAIITRLRCALTQLELGYQQRLFSEVFVQANLRNIYGQEEYKAYEIMIKRKNAIETLPVLTLVSLPRRSGKTKGATKCVAAGLVTIPDWSCVIFSPFQRQSDFFMDMVRHELVTLRELGYEFEVIKGKDNRETLGLRWGPGGIYETVMYALPAKEGSTRGITAKCIILEEMAVMPMVFFKKVPVPLLMVDGAMMIGISSILDTYNYFTALLNFDDERQHIRDAVYSYRFQAACNYCISKDRAKECTHMNTEIGEWLPPERREFVSAIYNALGDSDTMDQENLGISHNITECAFDHKMITRLFSKENPPIGFPERLPTNTVYCFLDPTGGGKSDLAMSTGLWHEGVFIILGMESMPLRDLDISADYAIKHLRKVRTMKGLEDSLVVIFIEANTPSFSYHFAKRVVNEMQNISIPDRKGLECKDYVMYSEGKATSVKGEKNIGVVTTNAIKAEMYEMMKQCLTHNVIRFHEDMVSVYENEEDRAVSSVIRVKQMLKTQGMDFSIHWKGPANPAFGKFYYTFSGKRAGSTQKDDLWMAFQGCLYDSSMFMNSINFEHLRRTLKITGH